MISSLRYSNFKCYRDTGHIELKPLTILVGPNSSGKSSFVQPLLLLKQSLLNNDPNIPLSVVGNLLNLGSYQDLIYDNDIKNTLSITININKPFYSPRIVGTNQRIYNLNLHLDFNYNKKTSTIRLEHHHTKINDNYDFSLTYNKRSRQYTLEYKDSSGADFISMKFHPSRPRHFHAYRVPGKLTEKAKDIPLFLSDNRFRLAYVFEQEFEHLYYLGPLREYPKRIYITSGQSPQDVGTRGENTIDTMWVTKRAKSSVIERVKSWLKVFGLSEDLDLQKIGSSNYFSVLLKDPASNRTVNLADVGFGASQAIPIIFECCLAPADSIIVLEQPEIHLHPKAQGDLADLFIDTVKTKRTQLIVETHSEYLISRLRRRMAEANSPLTKDDVAILYIAPSSEGTVVHKIELNDDGQFTSFPEGFFEESVTEAMAHLKAITERQKDR